MDKATVFEVVKAAFAMQVTPAPASGCGRVYVSVPKEHATAVAAAAKKLGIIFQRKAYYGAKNVLYIGYDNADGKALAKGEAVAEALTKAGIQAYSEAFGD